MGERIADRHLSLASGFSRVSGIATPVTASAVSNTDETAEAVAASVHLTTRLKPGANEISESFAINLKTAVEPRIHTDGHG